MWKFHVVDYQGATIWETMAGLLDNEYMSHKNKTYGDEEGLLSVCSLGSKQYTDQGRSDYAYPRTRGYIQTGKYGGLEKWNT